MVVKAQVHAGGRGKAGFVKVVSSAEEARDAAKFMLSNRMVSPQTGPEGLEVKRLLVAAGVDIAREFYLAIAIDRAQNTSTLIASAEGGVEIEAVAARNPKAILRVPLHPLTGLHPFQARQLAFDLGFQGRQVNQAVNIMLRLARLFLETDASLAEINPLVVTPASNAHADGQVIAIDAKFSFDDNALFRHARIADMFDASEENPAELRANKFGLSYVALDGEIGCLVNGAGLAMSTMDIIKLYGGEPANFLDVGGSATEEAVTEAFSIILSDDRVEGVLVNIFGGIMQCDKIARAIVAAATESASRCRWSCVWRERTSSRRGRYCWRPRRRFPRCSRRRISPTLLRRCAPRCGAELLGSAPRFCGRPAIIPPCSSSSTSMARCC